MYYCLDFVFLKLILILCLLMRHSFVIFQFDWLTFPCFSLVPPQCLNFLVEIFIHVYKFVLQVPNRFIHCGYFLVQVLNGIPYFDHLLNQVTFLATDPLKKKKKNLNSVFEILTTYLRAFVFYFCIVERLWVLLEATWLLVVITPDSQ